jgi:nicotinamide-nucleotide amidase
VMKFFGTGESDMEARLGEMIARDRVPRVGITVSEATLSLRITAMGETEAQCLALIEPTRKEILERVGDLFFGEGEYFEQYHAIDATLRKRNESLLIVELGYAALLGDWFASLGNTPAYRGDISFECASQLLQFTASDCLSSALVKLKTQANASWVLLVDRYPEVPKGDDAMLPLTAFRVDVLGPSNTTTSIDHQIAGHPDILHARVAKMAMAFFRKQLDLAEQGQT